MCKENRVLFYVLLLGLVFSCIAGALRAEEREGWYLILESELRSIERYKKTSEAEKQTWLLQAQALRLKAESLWRESERLNAQLFNQRNLNKTLTESFNRYELERLQILSLKNGEIADLKQEIADRKLELEKHKRTMLILVIAVSVLTGAWVIFIVIKL